MSPDNPQVVAVRGTPAPSIVVREQPTLFGRLGKWMFAALVLMVVALVHGYNQYHSYFNPANGPQEKYHSLSKEAMKKIAIITVDGAILNGEDSFVKKQIDRVRDDKDVVAVVLRIVSPGGSVTASDYLYHHLRKLVEDRKAADGRELPMVVSMGGVCASGGYYLAMAVGGTENAIFAEPTTWTGSIGVVIPHYDFSGSIAALRIKDDSLTSGPHKLMGSFTRSMGEEDRKLLQTLVDHSFTEFKAIVTSGRPKFKDDPEALDAVATGQIFTAKQALANGLVDRIGFVEEAIARAAELAQVSPDNVRCIKYDRPPGLLGELFGVSAAAPASDGIDLADMLNLTTPRAYYLWSSLPALLSNSAE
ncbi:MAG: signal peptide peptidase SppA [Pirellulales bacterium]